MAEQRPFEWEGASIVQLRAAMDSGKATAASLARQYLKRIAEVDKSGPALNSVIEVNPDALAIAQALDEERKTKGPRGPLHGVPVLVKDNLDTRDRMMTTAGSLALEGAAPPRDSFVVQKLREAGAVLLGKTNLSEWANIRSPRSTSGWSGRGGLTRHPYALDRNPCGSSSGSAVAVAASLCAVAVGTETDGSIICPSSVCGVVGIKPTLGLVSRSGIVPIAHSQDTAGPMARTVRDAAILLGVMAGADPRDSATEGARDKAERDYTRFLDKDGLRGMRIGVSRQFFDQSGPTAQPYSAALATLKACGATLVDPVNIPDHDQYGDAEFQVLLYELKADLNAYLAALDQSPVRTLAEVIEFNERNKEREMPWFGQEFFLEAQKKGALTDQAYVDAREKSRQLSRGGLDSVFAEHRLDALVAPSFAPACKTDLVFGDRRDTGYSSSPAAVSGYPSITVPAGLVHGLPVGISLVGRPWAEPLLISTAYGFEQANPARFHPTYLPTIG